jgi:response regulator RpfG family c-di-GMP phosphodiesterase
LTGEAIDVLVRAAELRGDEIPLAARVVSVADAYSAMTTRRAYSEALATQAAVGELRVNAGSQFDPLVVEAALVVLARDETRTIALTHGATAA